MKLLGAVAVAVGVIWVMANGHGHGHKPQQHEHSLHGIVYGTILQDTLLKRTVQVRRYR